MLPAHLCRQIQATEGSNRCHLTQQGQNSCWNWEKTICDFTAMLSKYLNSHCVHPDSGIWSEEVRQRREQKAGKWWWLWVGIVGDHWVSSGEHNPWALQRVISTVCQSSCTTVPVQTTHWSLQATEQRINTAELTGNPSRFKLGMFQWQRGNRVNNENWAHLSYGLKVGGDSSKHYSLQWETIMFLH